MFAVQDDWIQYEAVPAQRVAVRGGAACAQRIPVVRARPAGVPLRAVPSAPARRAPARTARSSRPARLRLTRRGRFVLVILPGLLAASGALVAVSHTPAAEAAQPIPVRTVVVGSGDSLWSVAERVEPDRDPRGVVAELQAANHLTGSSVAAGAVLRLPTGS